MKLRNIGQKYGKRLALACAGVVGMSSSSMAALDATTLTEIQTGVSGADANYFAIGGTILVVLAGIWGFKMVKRLF